MPDPNELEAKIIIREETAGLDRARDAMGRFVGEAKGATPAVAGLGKAAGELGETTEKLGFKTLREAAHATHGVETAMEGGHMSTLRWVMSVRGLWALLTTNPLVALATAIGVATMAIYEHVKSLKEAAEAADAEKEAFSKLFESLDGGTPAISRAEEAQKKLNEQYKASMASLADVNEKIGAQTKLELELAKAKEATALSQIKNDEATGKITSGEATARAAIVRSTTADQEDEIRKKAAEREIDVATAEADTARDNAERQRKVADQTKDRAKGLEESVNKYEEAKATYAQANREDFSGATPETIAANQRIGKTGMSLAQYKDYVESLKPKADVAKQVLGADWDEKNKKITETPTGIVAGARKSEEAAEKVEADAADKQLDLEEKKRKADEELQRQAAIAEERHKQEKIEADTLAVTEKNDKKKADEKEAKKESKNAVDWDSYVKGASGSGAGEAAIAQAKNATYGANAPGGTVSAETLRAVQEAEKHLEKAGPSAEGYAKLEAALVALAQTAAGKALNQDKRIDMAVAKIEQLTAGLKNTGRGGF